MLTLTESAIQAVSRFIQGSETPVTGLRVSVTGGKGQQVGTARRSGLPGRRLFEDDVRVRPADPERADAGAPRCAVGGPGHAGGRHGGAGAPANGSGTVAGAPKLTMSRAPPEPT